MNWVLKGNEGKWWRNNAGEQWVTGEDGSVGLNYGEPGMPSIC